MTPQDDPRPYKFIKDKDLPNLREVVATLKSQNLDVYISGSAMMVPEYGDIDLLICDPGFRIVTADDEAGFRMSPRVSGAIAGIINREGVTLKKRDHEYGGGYVGSIICGRRWELDYRGTSIDISYAQEPGGLTREKIARLESEMGMEMDLEPEYEKF